MKKNISLFTLAGLVIGIVLALLAPSFINSIAFIGTYYIKVLKYLIVPVVFTSICVSIYDSKNHKGNLLLKSIIVFIIMFVATFLLSSLITILINPAEGFEFEPVIWTGNTTNITFLSILANLLPNDLANFLTGGKLFIVIVAAYIIGFISTKVSFGKDVIKAVSWLRNILFKILEILTYVTPIAVLSLISTTVVNYGIGIIVTALKYIVTAYLSGIVCCFAVMILPVWIKCKINPIDYIKKVSRIWLMTLTTCSSSATLPYTMKVANEQFGVPEKITNVVVPLGCTIHMCGGAVSFSLLGLFCCKLYHVPVTLGRYLLMLVSSLLINMSAPGIPNGGVVIGATYLQLLGVPLDFIGFYSGIYKILDMLYTSLNVTGDITANVLIYQSNKEK